MKEKSNPLFLPLARKNYVRTALILPRKFFVLSSISILCHLSSAQKVSIASGNLNSPSTWTDLVNGKGSITIHTGENTGSYTETEIAVNDALFDNTGNFVGIVSNVSSLDFTLYYPSLTEINSANFLKQGTEASSTAPNAETVLVIRSGHEIAITEPFTTTASLVRQGIIKVSTTSNLTFGDNSTYLHYTPFANYHHIPIAASWAPTSTCFIYGVDETSEDPYTISLGQTFGNFIWNCPNQGNKNIDVYFQDETLIKGNLAIISTGNGSIVFTNTIPRILPINGNFTITGGTVTMSRGNKSQIINLNGDFIQTGGTITTASSFGTFMFNGNSIQKFRKTGGIISNKVNFEVSSGSTLDFDKNSYTEGNGMFTMNNEANLRTANVQGLNGSIQNTGTKSLSSNANYIYTGTQTQITGTDLPSTVHNLVINTPVGVNLSQSVSINGILDNQQGTFALNGKNLTLAGSLTRGGFATGTISGNTLSSIFITGSDDAGTLYLTSGEETLKNLSLKRTSGKISINRNLQITGQATFTEGVLKTEGESKLIFTSTGTCTEASDRSYVEGPVQKQSSITDFTFSVGKDKLYRPITTSGFTGSYTVEYFNTAYSNTDIVASEMPLHISPFEYWSIDNTSSTTNNLTFYWNYDQMPATDLTNLRLAYYDEEIFKWNIYPTSSTTINTGSTAASGSIALSNLNNKRLVTLASEEHALLHCPSSTIFYEASTPYNPGITYEWTLSKEIADLSFSKNNQRATLYFHGNIESDAELQLVVKENDRVLSKKAYRILTFPQNILPAWPTVYCSNTPLTLKGPQDQLTNTDYENYEWQKNSAVLPTTSRYLTDTNAEPCIYQLRVYKTTNTGSCWSKPFLQEIKFAELTPGGVYRKANW
jgi:hypothetical protein